MSNAMGSNIDKYWFESDLERRAHDVIREQYTAHAKAINHVIRPYIINSVTKERWTKGLGRDTYCIPCLHVRVSTDIEDKKTVPFHVMEAMIVNPLTGVGFVVDMKLGHVDNIRQLDFALFAEKINSAIMMYEADKGRVTKEGIIL